VERHCPQRSHQLDELCHDGVDARVRYPRAEAKKMMLEVHNQGRSLVWSGGREQAEHYVHPAPRLSTARHDGESET